MNETCLSRCLRRRLTGLTGLHHGSVKTKLATTLYHLATSLSSPAEKKKPLFVSRMRPEQGRKEPTDDQ